MVAEKIDARRMAGNPADDAEAVLKKLEESGVFDQLRRQLASQITSNVSSFVGIPLPVMTNCMNALRRPSHPLDSHLLLWGCPI